MRQCIAHPFLSEEDTNELAANFKAARKSLFEREIFKQSARSFEQLRTLAIDFPEAIELDIEVLEPILQEIQIAQNSIASCSFQSRPYIATHRRSVTKHLEDITHNIGIHVRIILLSAVQKDFKASAGTVPQSMQQVRHELYSLNLQVCRILEVDNAALKDSKLKRDRLIGICTGSWGGGFKSGQLEVEERDGCD